MPQLGANRKKGTGSIRERSAGHYESSDTDDKATQRQAVRTFVALRVPRRSAPAGSRKSANVAVNPSDGGVHAQLLGSAFDGLHVEGRKVRWPSDVGSDKCEVLAREVIY